MTLMPAQNHDRELDDSKSIADEWGAFGWPNGTPPVDADSFFVRTEAPSDSNRDDDLDA